MMDQTHIGYTSWMSPIVNIMPAVTELLDLPDTADIGVAVDGSPRSWPVGPASPIHDEPVLPPFDSLAPARSYIDIFARGTRPLAFHAAADQPWVRLTETAAPGAGRDRRVWVDIDWQHLPPGSSQAVIAIAGATGTVPVKVIAVKATPEQAGEARDCFGGLGPIAFAAGSATRNVAVNGVRWQRIPDYGRGISGMEVFPVTASTIQPSEPAPWLEYPVFFAKPGRYHISVTTSPTLDIVPERKLGLAVSIDDGPRQVPRSSRRRRALQRAFWDAPVLRTRPTMRALCVFRRRLPPPVTTPIGFPWWIQPCWWRKSRFTIRNCRPPTSVLPAVRSTTILPRRMSGESRNVSAYATGALMQGQTRRPPKAHHVRVRFGRIPRVIPWDSFEYNQTHKRAVPAARSRISIPVPNSESQFS